MTDFCKIKKYLDRVKNYISGCYILSYSVDCFLFNYKYDTQIAI